ncbi:hypothetical protein LMG24238_05002 [Paraburkholderia sediminicola]|uniref:Uncharacterized protein n=1 Tax=Paraburkholderia sediminicola TaxID=458836 RepID=A0A6J5C133_9BURK|nr:hypothetical protein [Paraburkholderia sediminicola]CAB3722152.1 hypothetical protein LMG24238_05002 [Paraburkholderia sediminicola]
MLNAEDLYESQHWRELDLRDKIDSRLQSSLTLVTAIIGALSFLLTNVDIGHKHGLVDYLFFALLAITFALLFLSGFYFFRSSVGSLFHRNTYKTLPVSTELERYKRGWDATIARSPQRAQAQGITSADELKKLLIENYLARQETNAKINDERAKNISNINLLVIVEALLTAAAFSIFYLGGLNKADLPKTQDIKITAPIDIRSIPSTQQTQCFFWFPPTEYAHGPRTSKGHSK